MDGTPQVVRFDATTLRHLDAAEWAPSTASKADLTPSSGHVRFAPESRHLRALMNTRPNLESAHLKSSKLSPSGPSAGLRSAATGALRIRDSGIGPQSRGSPLGAEPLPFPRRSATSATSATDVDSIGLFLLRSEGVLRSLSATFSVVLRSLQECCAWASGSSATFFPVKCPFPEVCCACCACCASPA